MRPRLQRADVVAITILGVLVSGVGTGIGLAAAHVRNSGSAHQPAPLRAMFSGNDGVPSLQRDRAHLVRR